MYSRTRSPLRKLSRGINSSRRSSASARPRSTIRLPYSVRFNGTVKRTEYGNLMVDLGRAEALLRRDELIPRESFRNGDRVREYIYDVREEPRGPQIFLSRTHPGFLAKLFAQEAPGIYHGIIASTAVAGDPGSRATLAGS